MTSTPDWDEIADAFAAGGAPPRVVDLLRNGEVEVDDIETSPKGHSTGGFGGTATSAEDEDRGKKANASIGVKGRQQQGRWVYKGWSSDVEPAICRRVMDALGRDFINPTGAKLEDLDDDE